MKKKLFLALMMVLTIALSVFAATSCEAEHVHELSAWQITKNPTCTSIGLQKRVCECGFVEYAAVDAVANTPVTDAIVIAPQCPSNRKWVNATWADGTYDINTVAETNELAAVVELIGKINEKYSCDENRHYIMGLSMGAYATWDLLARHTDMFAAAVAICGGADTSTAEKIKDIPIWAAHGTADSVVPCSGSQNMVQALKDAGSTSIHYTEYEGKPHAIWNIVAADPEILNWLFSQVRGTKQS